jgi:hypothetical protein
LRVPVDLPGAPKSLSVRANSLDPIPSLRGQGWASVPQKSWLKALSFHWLALPEADPDRAHGMGLAFAGIDGNLFRLRIEG